MSIGVSSVPNMLVSEMFPFKSVFNTNAGQRMRAVLTFTIQPLLIYFAMLCPQVSCIHRWPIQMLQLHFCVLGCQNLFGFGTNTVDLGRNGILRHNRCAWVSTTGKEPENIQPINFKSPRVFWIEIFPFNFSFVMMYYWLPETEKRSLEDIEIHFSDPTKKWTDIQIPKAKKSGTPQTQNDPEQT